MEQGREEEEEVVVADCAWRTARRSASATKARRHRDEGRDEVRNTRQARGGRAREAGKKEQQQNLGRG
jgi:hypothetical protein